MAERIRYTKIELKHQRDRLQLLNQYLPSLKLKKLMLQSEVIKVEEMIKSCERDFHREEQLVLSYVKIFDFSPLFDLYENLKIEEVLCEKENIAGIDIPKFKDIRFNEAKGMLFHRPFWFDEATRYLRALIKSREKVRIVRQEKEILENELREVSIRVNLFEKVLIPRTEQFIQQIQIFLGDLDLQAIAQAKVAKTRLLKRKKQEEGIA